MEILYDGKWPTLCFGQLIVRIGGKEWVFPYKSLCSGGSARRPWSIDKWPEGFPEEYKEAVVDAVNEKIPFGCCGGCL